MSIACGGETVWWLAVANHAFTLLFSPVRLRLGERKHTFAQEETIFSISWFICILQADGFPKTQFHLHFTPHLEHPFFPGTVQFK